MRKVRGAPRLLIQASLALLMLATVHPAHAASPAPVTGALAVRGNMAPPIPPVAALQANGVPSDGTHGLGFVPDPAAPHPVAYLRAALPAAVDLSQYNPPVGNQGSVNSCVSWATGYYLRGWYAKRDGYYPAGGAGGAGSFAPMYLYSQLVHGKNVGTYFKDNLNILQQGIDTRADYTQGDYDYTDQPTDGEIANAAHYRIASYSDVGGPNLQNWIEAAIAGGNPVVIGIPVYDNFYYDFAGSPNYTTYIDGTSGAFEGKHAVFASAYDANGVWIENSWGTGFGLHGYVELSWSFINQYAFEAVSETPLPATVTVPDVIGELPAQATSTLHAAGFAVVITSAVDHTCNYLRPGHNSI